MSNPAPNKGESPATAAELDPSAKYYRIELDCLRFVAFSLVFILHALPLYSNQYTALGVPDVVARRFIFPIVQGGGYGVDLFFTLSAFLITELLLRERERTGSVHIKPFYIRRALRIWPLYYVFLLTVGPLEWLFTKSDPTYYIWNAVFVGNWHLVNYGEEFLYTGHLWSVSVEEQFYLFWPLLLSRVKLTRFPAVLISIFGLTCLCRLLFVYISSPAPAPLWCNTLTHLDGFALGGLLAYALHKRRIVLRLQYRLAIFIAAFLLYWAMGFCPWGGYFGIYPILTYPLAAVASIMCIFASVSCAPRVTVSKTLRAFAYLGKISYGLYIFHLPFIRLMERLFASSLSNAEWIWTVRMPLAAIATLAVSAASYSWLEKPFLRMKRRFTYIESRPE